MAQRRFWWAALAIVLLGCLGAGAWALLRVPPVYRVWFGERLVATGRDLPGLQARLQAEAAGQMDRAVTLEAGGHRWTLRLSELGLSLSPQRLPMVLEETAAALPWWQRLPWHQVDLRIARVPIWDEQRLEAALAPIKAAVTTEPVPAKFRIVNRQPQITTEVPGTVVDTVRLRALLEVPAVPPQMSVPIKAVAPEVTRASLEGLGIKRVIAEWSTHYDATVPRGDNVAKGGKAFNGLLLKSGEILSANATIGTVDAAHGWKEAWVFENGEVVPGIGGGLCQVATTLYGAALRANLEIVERHQHQLIVTYVESSQDAAVSAPAEDLKIRNNTGAAIYIETETGGGTITFRLYGDTPADQEVRIESRVLSTSPYPTRVVPDDSLSPGEREVKMQGHIGRVSEAYRIVLRGGREVKREKLSKDTYLPTTEVVLVGPAPPPEPDDPDLDPDLPDSDSGPESHPN